jgi:hypothetical protein
MQEYTALLTGYSKVIYDIGAEYASFAIEEIGK